MSSPTTSIKSQAILIENGSEKQSNKQVNSQRSVLNQSTSQEYLQRLKQSLQISKEGLIQITNKNQFTEKVFRFNNEAKKLIEANKIQEALVYLNEAEKILEYAASSGKNIERKRIEQVLHNQACCYQILWDLEKWSNYIEALIFNFNSELKFGDFYQSSNGSQIRMSSSKNSLQTHSRIESPKIDKKIQLSKYYLLHCAINSQLKNNQGALVAAKKASQICITAIQELLLIFEEEKQNDPPSIQNLPPFVQIMLRQIPRITSSINVHNKDHLLNLVRHFIKVYKSKCVFNNLSSSKGGKSSASAKDVYQKYKKFSIGNIMQLQPVGDTSETSKDILEYHQAGRIVYEKLIQKLIVFSICQFTMATQLRYIALGNSKNDKQKSYQTIEFKESQIYHLLSILIVSMYIPFDVVYMEHIISSYHGHYKTALLGNEVEGTLQLSQEDVKRIKETVVFRQSQHNGLSSQTKKQEDPKKCSTTNQSNSSLIVSFHEEDEQESKRKSKEQTHINKRQDPQNQIISLVNQQTEFSDPEGRLFGDYYYVKKNTESDEYGNVEACEQNFLRIKKKTMNLSSLKSTSKGKKKSSKNNSVTRKFLDTNKSSKSKMNPNQSVQQNEKRLFKHQTTITKTQTKSKPSDLFFSKPSSIFMPSENHTNSPNWFQSQLSPRSTQSPSLIPQIYSKISKKSLPKKSNSKETNKKQTDCLKHQSQYFTKGKTPYNKQLKQKENSKPQGTKKTHSKNKRLQQKNDDKVKVQYFNVQDPNVARQNQKLSKNLAYKNDERKSESKRKSQRPSSKSLNRALSPSGLASKTASQSNNRLGFRLVKQPRQTQVLSNIYTRSTMSKNRLSVSSKKSERQTVHKLREAQLAQQSRRGSKANCFEKYYL